MPMNLIGWNSGLRNQHLVVLSPERSSVLIYFSSSVKLAAWGCFSVCSLLIRLSITIYCSPVVFCRSKRGRDYYLPNRSLQFSLNGYSIPGEHHKTVHGRMSFAVGRCCSVICHRGEQLLPPRRSCELVSWRECIRTINHLLNQKYFLNKNSGNIIFYVMWALLVLHKVLICISLSCRLISREMWSEQ